MKPIQIKVNTAGSWANLVTCAPSRFEAVKAACEAIAHASLGPVSFKAIDTASTMTIEQYSSQPRGGEPFGWYRPVCHNPIQAGLDRTTSGAIGQP